MEGFLDFLVSFGTDFILGLTHGTVSIINNVLDFFVIFDLQYININLVLFSDTAIYSGTLFELLILFFTIFYTVIFVVIWYKIIKKVFVKITGWKRW